MKYNKFIIFLFVLTSLVGCKEEAKDNNSDSKSKGSSSNLPTVKLVSPSSISFDALIHLTGNASPNKIVAVHAMEQGMVSSINKDIGDYVRKGDVLARLRNPEIARKIEKHTANFEHKKKVYDRLQKVFSSTPELTTTQMLETAEAEFKIAQAELNGLKDRSSFLSIRAPFNGIISQRFIEVGAMVQNALENTSSAPLFELVDDSKIRLTIMLAESDVKYASVGTKVEIEFPEISNEKIEASITRLANSLDPLSKTMVAEIDLDNSNKKIKTGMFAQVSIAAKSESSVLSLPHSASLKQNGAFYVYTVSEGIVSKIRIKKGLENGSFFQVVDGDVLESSKVVIEGKNGIKDGSVVSVHFGSAQ